MRLICPNCDAEYEVDDGAIPLSGRDVQCSNCGHSWFQLHPDAPAPLPDVTQPALPGEDLPAAAEIAEVPAVLPDDPPPPSTRLDAAALAMLKDEAARELAARRATAPIEVQADLGLPPPAPAPVFAPPPPALAPEAAPTPSRRSRLPDIEEINSTLRPQGFPPGYDPNAGADAGEAAEPSSGSFRAGFLLIIALAVALTVVYALAPQIAAAVPALDTALASYVQTVDAMRLWLDGALRGLIDSLRGLAEPAG